jgi:hypothetical protein
LPGGVVEGVADWIREMNNLGPPHWHEGPSQDEIWDAGYQTTVSPAPLAYIISSS